MFYSQFILAKKGPLGTIWIAAHLERKLRKNQVADTDIGVSVDSILFPEVPIALRLSSHLLLGVVRIYSRKVNYLFDDCSEALLKIKQAFRSTAVDLPPEESTAPYHSITLPETFDLDDFELPDNDIFQGNYVDHHVSSREQITLQDTMEGVVYSTSQFGLDERFGDGDTSGLDLDEELLVDKDATVGHADLTLSSNADPQASAQPITPFKQDENQDTVTANLETMPATGSVNQIEDFDEDNDPVEYAQAPCTPGLWEEPNLSNIQETSACDDHIESENHYVTESAMKENLENASGKSDSYNGRKSVVDWPSLNDMNSASALCMPTKDNEYLLGDPEQNQLDPQENSRPPAVTMEHISMDNLVDEVGAIAPVEELPGWKIPQEKSRPPASNSPDRVEDLQNVIPNFEGRGIYSVDEIHEDCADPHGDSLNESTLHMPRLTSSCQPVSEGISENNQASLEAELSNNVEIAGNLEKSCHLSNGLESNTEFLNRCNLDKEEAVALQEQTNSKMPTLSVHENMACPDFQVLRPCITHLNQPDKLTPNGDNSVDPDLPSDVPGLRSLETFGREEPPHSSGASILVQGEGSHATNGSEQISEKTYITEPASHEDIQVASSKSNDQADNVILGVNQVENIGNVASSDLPAPEKLLSVAEGLTDVPNNLLLETTPYQGVLFGGDGRDAESDILAGKKRSFTESSLTVQSLNLVESSGVFSTKITAESIPDDDDLLSSILVGRKSSVLKMKPTPPLEITSMKRRRSAPRISASKRKVLMDDTMVLHGDTIRQQLTSTEDIRRLRKKAPCTRPEISMIQKQFWEDELFSEAIFSGVSMELASLHNQPYDLSKIRVSQNDSSFEGAMDLKSISQNDENATQLEAANDLEISNGQNVIEEIGKEASFVPAAVGDYCEAQPVETPVLTDNQPWENNIINSGGCSSRLQMHPTSNVSEPRSSEHELCGETTAMEIDGNTVSEADVRITAVPVGVESSLYPTDLVSGDTCDLSAGMIQLVSFDKTSETDASLQMDAPGLRPDQKLDMLSVEMDASMDINSNKGVETNLVAEIKDDMAAVEAESRANAEFLLERTECGASVEIIKDITDCLEHTQTANPSAAYSPENDGGSTRVVTTDLDVEEIRKNDQDVVNEDAALDAEVEYGAENLVSNGICREEFVVGTSYAAEVNVGWKDVSLYDKEILDQQEAYPLTMTDVEAFAIDRDDRDDLDYSEVGHDTDFLNVDDDEVAEADDDFVPNAEETRFIDNSGWSSRTKAVAKYLQTLFDKEAERGRKVVPMDSLLAGKTRREASRMFFEALVLKTKDYIHVEQNNSFDNINMLPRAKLMKSDF